MNFEEIAIAFKNCNGDLSITLKDYLLKQSYSPQTYESGITCYHLNNYILSDTEKLWSKAIINALSADILLQNGYVSWGLVTSYYSSFFSIQALNRLQLNFNLWTQHSIICQNINYVHQEVKFLKVDQSKGSHENQFHLFFKNYQLFKNRTGIDRYWNIGLQSSRYGFEPGIRNEVNYSLSEKHFFELTITLSEHQRILKQLRKSPFLDEPKSHKKTIDNIARNSLMLCLSRIRMIAYILNFMANSNNEYKSYFIRNVKSRLDAINNNYPNRSAWIYQLLNEWLCFYPLETDDTV